MCATPIGHLADCSFYLREVLTEVSFVVAEDTRRTAILLSYFGLKKPMVSLDQHVEKRKTACIVDRLMSGETGALVSDAGTPGIADPGTYLVSSLAREGIAIKPVPGPSAVTALVSVSGLAQEGYSFQGFYPRKAQAAALRLQALEQQGLPAVFFESPRRIVSTFEQLNSLYPGATVVCAKELTKTHERLLRGTPAQILARLETELIKGEWCFIIQLPQATTSLNKAMLDRARQLGLSTKTIVSLYEPLGWSKNEMYQYLIAHD